jgi:hypothetical protein
MCDLVSINYIESILSQNIWNSAFPRRNSPSESNDLELRPKENRAQHENTEKQHK